MRLAVDDKREIVVGKGIDDVLDDGDRRIGRILHTEDDLDRA